MTRRKRDARQYEVAGRFTRKRRCSACDFKDTTNKALQDRIVGDQRAFAAGWKAAAAWANRDDLVADIGSPAYEADREKYLTAAQLR